MAAKPHHAALMMRAVRTAFMFSGLVVLAACNTLSAREDVPAVLVDSTENTRMQLQQAISTALNGRQVTVSRDALTRTSELILERARRRDSAGLPIMGRDLDDPEVFTLVKNGEQCALVHRRTGKRFTLASVKCSAASQ